MGEGVGSGSLLQRSVQTMTSTSDAYSEFIGVYNAESTVLGEVSYWIGARLGLRHCSLCDITHGLFTKRAEWQECESALHIPFTTFHINDAPTEVSQAAMEDTPLFLAEISLAFTLFLTPMNWKCATALRRNCSTDFSRYDASPCSHACTLRPRFAKS